MIVNVAYRRDGEDLRSDGFQAYRIDWSDGASETCDTYENARDVVTSRYPDAEIGHDGDLEDGGDRTLCWESEEEAEGDDGQRSIAAIRRA